MAASGDTKLDAVLQGIGMMLERIGEVQAPAGEEEVADYASFDGSELPPVDPDSVIVVSGRVLFRLQDGTPLALSVSPSTT